MFKKNCMLLITVLVLGLGNAALAVDPNDFSGTDWVLWGKSRASAAQFGSTRGSGILTTSFYNDGTIAMEDDEGYVIYGTYNFDDLEGNLEINVTPENILVFFDTYLSDTLPNVDGLIWDISVPSSNVQTKTIYRNNIISLSIKLNMSVKLHLEYDGKTYDIPVSILIKAAGDHPAASSPSWGSQWIIDAKMKAGVKGLKAAELPTLKLILGNYESSGLGQNDYQLYDITGGESQLLINGVFCRNRQKVTFFGSNDNLQVQALIHDSLTQAISDSVEVDSFDIAYEQSKWSAKVKEGQTITFSGKTRFHANVFLVNDYSSEYGFRHANGSFTLTGKGLPLP